MNRIYRMLLLLLILIVLASFAQAQTPRLTIDAISAAPSPWPAGHLFSYGVVAFTNSQTVERVVVTWMLSGNQQQQGNARADRGTCGIGYCRLDIDANHPASISFNVLPTGCTQDDDVDWARFVAGVSDFFTVKNLGIVFNGCQEVFLPQIDRGFRGRLIQERVYLPEIRR